MFVVVGANGKTGRAVLQALRKWGHEVRAVVRGESQADALRKLGVDAAVADLADVDDLTRLFQGAEAVYAFNPPAYKDDDPFVRAGLVHSALLRAAEAGRVGRIVALSSVGAQHAAGTGNILTTHDFETQLAQSSVPHTILRAANFIDNWAWVLPLVKKEGILPSMLLPVDRRIPCVAACDVGEAAARLMVEGGDGLRIVELHGPSDYSPRDAAETLGVILNRSVEAVGVREEEWIGIFRNQGMPAPSASAFAEMYRGFNSGLIAFDGNHETRTGPTSLDKALAEMVATSNVME